MFFSQSLELARCCGEVAVMVGLALFAVYAFLAGTHSASVNNIRFPEAQFEIPKDLEPYLQPDEPIVDPTNPYLCNRECVEDEPPKICYYKFFLEGYASFGSACGDCPNNVTDCFARQCITADGVERALLAVNRMYPGPPIHVCQNDLIVVDVKNGFTDRSTSIHFHGLNQRGTPYSDGVPMVSQCPISPGQVFRHSFRALQVGTYFWHSHSGLQKLDGIQGAVVIRQPKEIAVHSQEYDYDDPNHIIFVTDWLHIDADQKLPGRVRSDQGQRPDTYLINGRGEFKFTNQTSPLTVYNVNKGERYLFRIISGTCLSCSVAVSIDQHKIKLLALDGGNYVKPEEFDTVILLPGERLDVVIETSQPVSSYVITARGLDECSAVKQTAILKYEGSEADVPQVLKSASISDDSMGINLNLPNSPCLPNQPNTKCTVNLQGIAPVPKLITDGRPNYRFLIEFGYHVFTKEELFNSKSYPRYMVSSKGVLKTGTINNITFISPSSPVMTQINDVDPNIFCKASSTQTFDQCLNVMKVPTGSMVELIVTDSYPFSETGSNHPIHTHGYYFYVTEQGIFPKIGYHNALDQLVKEIDSKKYSSSMLPSKDTIGVSTGGYVVLRFIADNPGIWLMHCHFAYHLDLGMIAALQVGEFSEYPKVPEGFPKCGSYTPSS